MVEKQHISDNALSFWLGFFMNPKSTLSFGGEGATRKITSEAKKALEELIREGYVEALEETSPILGREYYRSTGKSLVKTVKERAGGSFDGITEFMDNINMVAFEKVGD